jgi:DNA polymerase-3 subunit beta
MIMLEMSLPNRAGILTPVDGLEEGETVTMLVMPVMLTNKLTICVDSQILSLSL